MTHEALLWYMDIHGKEHNIIFPSLLAAKQELKKLKRKGIIKTYKKDRVSMASVYKSERCPSCNKAMVTGDDIVWLFHQKGDILRAHRKCCEKNKIPYRDHTAEKGDIVVYPK